MPKPYSIAAVKLATCIGDASSAASLFLAAFLDGGGVGTEESIDRRSTADPALLFVLAGVLVALTEL